MGAQLQETGMHADSGTDDSRRVADGDGSAAAGEHSLPLLQVNSDLMNPRVGDGDALCSAYLLRLDLERSAHLLHVVQRIFT
jgi:hypothetical protein